MVTATFTAEGYTKGAHPNGGPTQIPIDIGYSYPPVQESSGGGFNHYENVSAQGAGATASILLDGTIKLHYEWEPAYWETDLLPPPTPVGCRIHSYVGIYADTASASDATLEAVNIAGNQATIDRNSYADTAQSVGSFVASIGNGDRKTTLDFGPYKFHSFTSTVAVGYPQVTCDHSVAISWGTDSRGVRLTRPGAIGEVYDAATNTTTGDTTYSYAGKAPSPGGAGGYPHPSPWIDTYNPNTLFFQGAPIGDWSPWAAYSWSNLQPNDTRYAHSESMPYGLWNKDPDGNWEASGTAGAPDGATVTYTVRDSPDGATGVATYKLNLHHEWENWRSAGVPPSLREGTVILDNVGVANNNPQGGADMPGPTWTITTTETVGLSATFTAGFKISDFLNLGGTVTPSMTASIAVGMTIPCAPVKAQHYVRPQYRWYYHMHHYLVDHYTLSGLDGSVLQLVPGDSKGIIFGWSPPMDIGQY